MILGRANLMVKPDIVREVYLQWEKHAKPIVCNASGASTAMVDRVVDLLDINLEKVHDIPCCLEIADGEMPEHVPQYK